MADTCRVPTGEKGKVFPNQNINIFSDKYSNFLFYNNYIIQYLIVWPITMKLCIIYNEKIRQGIYKQFN